jgi:hypothetical protein
MWVTHTNRFQKYWHSRCSTAAANCINPESKLVNVMPLPDSKATLTILADMLLPTAFIPTDNCFVMAVDFPGRLLPIFFKGRNKIMKLQYISGTLLIGDRVPVIVSLAIFPQGKSEVPELSIQCGKSGPFLVGTCSGLSHWIRISG